MSAPTALFARGRAARSIAFARVLQMGEQRLREMDEAARLAPPQDRGADALAWAALKSFLADVRREAALPAPCICGECEQEITANDAAGFRADAHPVHVVCPDALRQS